MRLLAFEAATRRLSVALRIDGETRERSADLPNSGSEVLLPWAHELLAEAGIGLGQLDGLAFGAGPGGFTGLRLACGVVQGLAWGLDLPVAPVSTLQALALAAGDGKAWTILDARMNEVYAAGYRVDGDAVTEIAPPACGPPAVLPAPTFAPDACVGDGFASYPELRARASGARWVADAWPTAAAVSRLGAGILAAGRGVRAADAQPVYVRDKVALTTAERLARGGAR